MNNKEVKGGLLKPFEICEYIGICRRICNGRNSDRNNTFSCALRRGLLIVNGFDVKYGITIDEALK